MRLPVVPPTPRPYSRQGFTLLELLIVMVIMASLFGLVMSTVGTGQSRNLSNAGSLVANLCQQARQNSISRNVMTAFVISNASDSELNGRRLILVEYSGTPLKWRPVTAWTTLPSGTFVDIESNKFYLPPALVDTPISLPDSAGKPVKVEDCVYQIFAPGGLLLTSGTAGQPSLLPLMAGRKDAPQNPDNYYDVIVNPFTGIAKVDRP
jgi:prepilin-type N-terminal cleavage/methylation domain-containing protein